MKRYLTGRPAAFLAAVVVLLLLTGAALAADGSPDISRYVVGGGGGHSEAGPFALDATAGQAVAGYVSSGHFALCAGFWCGMGEYRIDLPLVLRG
jgi:hypothetical protein